MSDRKVSSGSTSKGWERSQGLEDALHRREDAIRSRKTEYAGVYDSDGNTILEKHGKSGSVSFNFFESMAMEGSVMTHNHPNDSCFSQADIDSAERTGLLEIRATTSTGKTHCLRRMKASDAKRGSSSGMGTRYEIETSRYMDTALRPAVTRSLSQRPKESSYKTRAEFVREYNAWVDRHNAIVRSSNAKFDSFCSNWLRQNAGTYGWRYREEQR